MAHPPHRPDRNPVNVKTVTENPSAVTRDVPQGNIRYPSGYFEVMDSESLFDGIVDQHSADSLKWTKYRQHDIIPMWVADMDFRCSDAILQSLRQRIEHGILGYSVRPEKLNLVVAEWVLAQHGWPIQEDWIVWLPGLVCGLNAACRGLLDSNQEALTFTPIYPPFLTAPEYSRRHLVRCPLAYTCGRYTIDFDRLKSSLTNTTALLLLCSPHNPVGRVWTKPELDTLVEICTQKNIVLCSDEIHCDLVLEDGVKHCPTASLSEQAAQQTITLMSASKTFNIAGLSCAFAIIPNAQLRRRFRQALFGIVPHVNVLGYSGTLAAFRDSRDWYLLLIEYLRKNRDFLYRRLQKMPGLRMDLPEATYLAWIDTRAMRLENPVHFFEQAGVGVSDGAEFDGAGFVRLNYGCPKALLEEAIKRIERSITTY